MGKGHACCSCWLPVAVSKHTGTSTAGVVTHSHLAVPPSNTHPPPHTRNKHPTNKHATPQQVPLLAAPMAGITAAPLRLMYTQVCVCMCVCRGGGEVCVLRMSWAILWTVCCLSASCSSCLSLLLLLLFVLLLLLSPPLPTPCHVTHAHMHTGRCSTRSE